MKIIAMLLAGTLLGAGAMYFVKPSQVPVPVADAPSSAQIEIASVSAAPPTNEPVAHEIKLTADPSVTISNLQARVMLLERELATLRAVSQPIPPSLPAVARGTNAPEQQTWLEELRAKDPQRYQEVVQRREEGRQSARYEIARRAAHYLNLDKAAMTPEEVEQRERLLDLLHQSLDLTEKLEADLSEEERADIARSLRRNMRDLSPLLDSERERALYRMGKDIGYTDDDAAAFALYVRDVVDLTSVRSIYRNGLREMGGWGEWDRRGEGGPEGSPR